MAAKGPLADDLSTLLDRVEKWLARKRKHFLKGLRPGATAAELQALAKSLNQPVPAELATLVAWHNGQDENLVGGFEQDWQLMSTAEIAQAKTELKDQPALVPVFADPAGNYLCLDTTQSPPPLRSVWVDSDKVDTFAPSLTAWLREFVENLEKGKYEEDPERGTLQLRGD